MTATATRSRSRKSFPRKSNEDRQAERTALLDQLSAKVDTLASSDEWINYLKFMRSFHRYSFNNQMLIMMQCPEATRVAGFRKWQSLGRQVRKGERAIKILGFSQKKITETDPVTGEETDRKINFFPVLSVFDVSQTDGDPLPTVDYSLPTGDGPQGAYDTLAQWLGTQGWTVELDAIAGAEEGFTSPQTHKIVVRDTLAPAAQLAVLLHEAAHALLHSGDDVDYQGHRGQCEVEAESTAYVVAGLLGLDMDASSVSYVTGWSGANRETLANAAGNVVQAVNKIASALGLDEDEDEE